MLPDVTPHNATCLACGKPFRVKPSRLRGGRGKYCSRACHPNNATSPASFWAQVDMATTPDGCHEWQGPRSRYGYGRVSYHGKEWPAHRLAWVLTHGGLPDDQIVRHVVCDNPPCCRPDHLLPGTCLDNMGDAVQKGRHAHGSRQGSAKLSEADVLAIRALYSFRKVTQRMIAERYGLTERYVGELLRRESWKHLP